MKRPDAWWVTPAQRKRWWQTLLVAVALFAALVAWQVTNLRLDFAPISKLITLSVAVPLLYADSQPQEQLATEEKQTVIDVRGPTIVAFFPPVPQKELESDQDTNEALADFQYYAGRVRDRLKRAGIRFHELYATSFDVRVGRTRTTFRPASEVGYYLAAPNKKPRIEYGVKTDADLLSVAAEYFGPEAGLSAQQNSGLICVAPYPEPVCSGGVCRYGDPELICASDNVSLKVDSREAIPWPKKDSISVDGLALDGTHRVVVLCDGKPQQSFRFRFSEFKNNKACLWMNDLYRTVQLWELDRHAPSCKCKDVNGGAVSAGGPGQLN